LVCRSGPFSNDFSPRLGRIFADGADVVDYLAEIPLPGRILAAPPKILARGMVSAPIPSFVAGPENRIVAATVNRLLDRAVSHAGLRHDGSSITEALANSYPCILALFGPSGVGKTHLAHGLIRHWQRQLGDHAAHYTSAADFRREFNEAMSSNQVEAFRDDLRRRRLLAIDDLHRLPNDDYLMQELRHTLDAVQEHGGLLVVTSPRPALALSNVPPDIRSRMASGLSLQLAPPGSAARVRIIRHVSSALGRDLSLDAASQLAEVINGNAPQVFGALFELWATPGVSGASDASRTAQLTAMRAKRQPTLPEIITVVAKYINVPKKQLKSRSRRQSIVLARAVAAYLARELTAVSYAQIGRALGGRDHTTIIHSYKKIGRQLTSDLAVQETIDDIRRILLRR
jgi:chromosomal replication initiator protein